MERTKAVLIFHPNHRPEQLDFVTARTAILHEIGNQAWVAITDAQATLFAGQGILVQVFPEADLIQTPAALFDPLDREPQPPADLTAVAPTGDATAYYLVQFVAPPDASWLNAIAENSALYIQDNPVHAAIFRCTAEQAATVRELDFVRWVGLYHPAYALSYDLAGRDEPYAAHELSDLHVDPAQMVATDTGTLEVVFFDDLTRIDMQSAILEADATISTDTGYSLIINIAAERVVDLLRVQGVYSIERYLPAQPGDQRAGVIVGTNQVRNFRNISFLVNLDGIGEIAGVIDTGCDSGGSNPPAAGDPPLHADLAGRIQFRNLYAAATPANTVDTFPHGTHVTGIIAGNGTQSAAFPGAPPPNPTTVRGMAPACQIIFHAARNPALGGAHDFRGFLAGFIAAHNAGARVHSNSWGRVGVGTVITNNLYNNATSVVIDRFAFLNPEDLVLFLSHNDERDSNGDGILDMRHLPRESVAKNILCVGASENVTNIDGDNRAYNVALPGRFGAVAGAGPAPVAGNAPMSDNADNLALFSNRGRVATPAVPPAQRRVKPDLVAPGTNILSTRPVALPPFPAGSPALPNTAPTPFYYVDSGTSMATPRVAGAAVLTRQFFRQRFGQLRRPLLLEQLHQLVDRPAIAPHTAGLVMAWVRRDTVANQNHIAAARFDHTLARVGNVMQVQTNVGDHPAPMLARRRDITYLLHRGSDNALRLGCYDANLNLINGFGTNGVVTLTPASRPEDDRQPALCVHGNSVAVVWNPLGGDDLVIQRFAADTGAALDPAPIALGSMSNTASHPFIINTGTRYAVVWARQDAGNYAIRMRLVDNNGSPVGAQPQTLFQQAAALTAPHLLWDARYNRFILAWVDSRTSAAGSLYSLRADENGNPIGIPEEVLTVPAGATLRRPCLCIHPAAGYVLHWEDNTQPGESDADPNTPTPRFDVYLTFLDSAAKPDGRISGNRQQISDTTKDTAGFACLVDNHHITPIWQSNDEINSDLLGAYVVNLTFAARFQAQLDSNMPLIDSGNYIPHLLHEHRDTTLTGVACAWAGGDVYLLHTVPDSTGISAELHLVRVNADGLTDIGFGANGTRRIDFDIGYDHLALRWADTRLIVASSFGTEIKLFLFDLRRNGDPVHDFGVNGRQVISEPTPTTIAAQVSHAGTGNTFRVFVAYGQFGTPTHSIRYAVLDRRGNFTVAARDLVAGVAGTAAHGWFHFVESDVPARSIAVWHQHNAGNMAIFANRFQQDGRPHSNRPHISITTLAGDSQHAVVAPRPVTPAPAGVGTGAAINQSRQREYGVAWQYRPNAGAPWEIRFSRLARDGTVAATHDVQVISDPAHHHTDPQLVWHSNGYGVAFLEQPTGGGNHVLCFTVLNDNGAPLDLNFGVGAPAPAPIHCLSAADADVQDFELVWNGRTFRIAWTETRRDEEFVFNGAIFVLQPTEPKVRRMQAAIAVPRKPGPAGYARSYEHPSAALVRATLINGATNIRRTALPNIGNDPNDGYGWGRLNLRQSLAPLPPVTFYARDDTAVASGHTIRYRFRLPVETRLLRTTLAWTDPPGVQLVNNLNLSLTAPDGRVFVGNRWRAGGPPHSQFSDPLPLPAPVTPFEAIHNVEQIVIPGAPTLPPGEYVVEVRGGPFRNNAFQIFPGQPFALVFVGSGDETRFGGVPGGPLPVY
jgi:subtilisin family serine protease